MGRVTPADRRREPRRSATGKVHLRFESGLACSLDVDLLDVSDSGFRAMHRHGLLPLGANAIFRHPHAFGIARVVWNWINGDDVETGFVIMR